MTEQKYFEREYNYLQYAGEEFARRHETLGSMLRMSEKQRKDPFVERLFEAFAFLAGRIHERLDDDMPEFAGGLLEQLFPHFLRPFPSCAILEARGLNGALSKAVTVPIHSQIQTPAGRVKVKYRVTPGPGGKHHTEEKIEPADFIFRTTRPLTVHPMRLRSVRIEDEKDDTSALILQFQPHRNVDYASLNLDRLQLYLHGSHFLKYSLLYYLNGHVSSISVRELTGREDHFASVKPYRIGIPGLSDGFTEEDEDGALVPYARQTFRGYRLLQEYFAFPERFFFVEIRGLNQFEASGDGHPFEVKIAFDTRISRELRPTENDIRINCVPIVNLFDAKAEPVMVNHRQPEYQIIPDADRRKSKEIYAVKSVAGVGENRQKQFSYTPITSYDLLDIAHEDYDYKRFFSIVRREAEADMAVTAIRLFGPSMAADEFAKESLSIDAIMSNGYLPAKYLKAHSLNEPVNFPQGVEASNLTVPTDVLPNPDRQNFLWALIAHLSMSYTTLADTETLRTLLGLYNWSRSQSNPNRKKIMQGIVQVHPPVPKNIYRNRGLIRGIEFRVDINAREFENGQGDIYLFGLVLSHFLAQYLTINSFVMLTFRDIESDRVYIWQPNIGKISPV